MKLLRGKRYVENFQKKKTFQLITERQRPLRSVTNICNPASKSVTRVHTQEAATQREGSQRQREASLRSLCASVLRQAEALVAVVVEARDKLLLEIERIDFECFENSSGHVSTLQNLQFVSVLEQKKKGQEGKIGERQLVEKKTESTSKGGEEPDHREVHRLRGWQQVLTRCSRMLSQHSGQMAHQIESVMLNKKV